MGVMELLITKLELGNQKLPTETEGLPNWSDFNAVREDCFGGGCVKSIN